MSQVFEGYERQYCDLSVILFQKCNSASTLPLGAQRNQQLYELNVALDEADVLIRKMDLEARSLQPSLKITFLAKLREYKADMYKLKKEVKKLALDSSNQAGPELLEAGAYADSSNQRERLATSTVRLDRTSDRVRDSRRTALGSEEHGVTILDDLQHQRETLLNSHKKLHGVDDSIDKSNKSLSSMTRRMSRNKCIVGSVIAVLVLAIIFILYLKLSP